MTPEARYHVPSVVRAIDPLADILLIYEDIDALLAVALDAEDPARKLELAHGAVSKMSELTRRISALSVTRPDLITALEGVR